MLLGDKSCFCKGMSFKIVPLPPLYSGSVRLSQPRAMGVRWFACERSHGHKPHAHNELFNQALPSNKHALSAFCTAIAHCLHCCLESTHCVHSCPATTQCLHCCRAITPCLHCCIASTACSTCLHRCRPTARVRIPARQPS